MIDIVASGAVTTNRQRDILWGKAQTTPRNAMSVVKTMTGYLVYEWISNLNHQVTVVSSDTIGGSTMGLRTGDVLTIRDLLHGMMLPSGNDAAQTLGRIVGQEILNYYGQTGNANARFVQEMNAQGSSWGWSGHNFRSASGISPTTSQMSPTQVSDLLWRVLDDRSHLMQIMGTRSYNATVFGSNSRTISLTHTINPDGEIKIPEFLFGKTGSGGSPAVGNVGIIWENPENNQRFASVVLASTRTGPQRYVDLRAMIDSILGVSGSLRWGRNPPVSMSFGGRNVREVKYRGLVVWP